MFRQNWAIWRRPRGAESKRSPARLTTLIPPGRAREWISILNSIERASLALLQRRESDAARSDTRDLRRHHGQGCQESRRKAETTDLRTVFAACVLFRVVNALCVRTFFSADEYWQSVEVAHKLVFGYGHLTWEWTHGLRGYLHPLDFPEIPYKIAQTIGLDSTAVTVWSPRIVQAVIAAAGDVHVYKLAHRWFAGAKKEGQG